MPDVLLRPVRRLQHALALDSAQHSQDFRRANVGNGAAAQVGEHVALEASNHLVPVACGLGAEGPVNPRPRYGLEAVGSQCSRAQFLRLLDGAGVAPGGQVCAGFVALSAGGLKAHGGIYPQRQALFCPQVAVFQPPEFAA